MICQITDTFSQDISAISKAMFMHHFEPAMALLPKCGNLINFTLSTISGVINLSRPKLIHYSVIVFNKFIDLSFLLKFT